MIDLTHKKCKPCEGGVEPLTHEQIQPYLAVISGWTVTPDGKQISKEYRFTDFKSALGFVDAIGELAESEGHHPDIFLTWGRVVVTLSTHAIKGLTENDFIMAYKIDTAKNSTS